MISDLQRCGTSSISYSGSSFPFSTITNPLTSFDYPTQSPFATTPSSTQQSLDTLDESHLALDPSLMSESPFSDGMSFSPNQPTDDFPPDSASETEDAMFPIENLDDEIENAGGKEEYDSSESTDETSDSGEEGQPDIQEHSGKEVIDLTASQELETLERGDSGNLSEGEPSSKPKKKPRRDEIHYDDILFKEKIGEGSFGEVYHGTLWGQEVAIKKLRIKGMEDKIKDFKKEIKIMRTLRHPNIVEFLGACVDTGKMCILTEYLGNGSLEDLLERLEKRNKKMGLKRILQLAKDIARGLNWLHHKGIIHRDLKTANILVDETGRGKIADFGLSHMKKRTLSMKNEGGLYGVCGTPCYMAPEVINKQPYGEKADVFSFGIVLCELMMGKYPYENEPESTNTFEQAIVSGLRPVIPNEVHPYIRDLIKLCWAEAPEDRPSMDIVMKRLQEIEKQLLSSSEDLSQSLDELPEPVQKLFTDAKARVSDLELKLDDQKRQLFEANRKIQETTMALEKERVALERAKEELAKREQELIIQRKENNSGGRGRGRPRGRGRAKPLVPPPTTRPKSLTNGKIPKVRHHLKPRGYEGTGFLSAPNSPPRSSPSSPGVRRSSRVPIPNMKFKYEDAAEKEDELRKHKKKKEEREREAPVGGCGVSSSTTTWLTNKCAFSQPSGHIPNISRFTTLCNQ